MSTCLVCGKTAEEAIQAISRGQYLYEDEGEWVCSDECLRVIVRVIEKENK